MIDVDGLREITKMEKELIIDEANNLFPYINVNKRIILLNRLSNINLWKKYDDKSNVSWSNNEK